MSLSYEYQKAIFGPEWAKRSGEIKKRDNFRCQHCGSQSNPLHVHHKYYVAFRLPHEYPVEALITLCTTCHHKAHLNHTPRYQEGDLELIRIEVPQLYETEVQRRKSESKQSEMLAKQREDDKLSIGHMILAPFALIIHLLLWLGKFLIMSFVTLLIFGVVSFSFSTIGFDLVGSTMGLILAAISFIFMWKKYGSELF